MIYFSALLPVLYPTDAETLFTALTAHDVPYALLDGTRDVWVRDFMPVRTGSGKLVSFRYEPSYLKNDPDLRTDFRKDLAPQLGLPVTYSNINLDGGNVVFSPSGARVLISDRVFSENPEYPSAALMRELSELLETEVLGQRTAEVTHNHPEGIKAARVTAGLVYLGREGRSMDELRAYAGAVYEIPTCDAIRSWYEFDETCQGTMPAVFAAFFDSTGFEDAIRNAISVGGDSDTIAAITGSIAEGYYGVPDALWKQARQFLPIRLDNVVRAFYKRYDLN